MSERSEEFRARARSVIDQFSQSNDPYIRELSLSIARSYHSIARSEEWIGGEQSTQGFTAQCERDPECRRLI